MQVNLKNMPKLRLADLLRRRKMTLEQFITESGVQTYAALVIRCQRIGVRPPSEGEYTELRPDVVTSPTDGVIVLEPPSVIDEKTGSVVLETNNNLLEVPTFPETEFTGDDVLITGEPGFNDEPSRPKKKKRSSNSSKKKDPIGNNE